MKRNFLALAAMLLGIGIAWQSSSAQGLLNKKVHHAMPPVCEPGYKIVEEVTYKDVVKEVCRIVPEHKKKWVYSYIDDPFCIRDTKHGDCPNCSGPYCRKQLVKRQVYEDCPTLKCEVDHVVERIAVVVYKKVPCDAPVTTPAVAPAPAGRTIEQIPVLPTPLKPTSK